MRNRKLYILRAAITFILLFIAVSLFFVLTSCTEVSDTETESFGSSEQTETATAVQKTDSRLPSVPEEMWDHVFLEYRDRGSCLQLDGKAAFLCVFVNDEESRWTPEEINAAKLEFDKAAEFISKEAKRYGAETEIVLTYAEGTVEDPDAAFWFDCLMENAGYKNEGWAREKVRRDADAANGAVVLCYNNADRSYARRTSIYSSAELMVLYECDSFTFVHEALHLFGAVDFYYPEQVQNAALDTLGNSIMNEDIDLIDSFTAYAVGWTDVISDEALDFLRATSDLTEEALAEAYEEETYTGYVENRRVDNGVYTGEMKNGVMFGKGTLSLDNGDVYEGDIVYGLEHGYGIYTWANGDVYEGDFVDGKASGKGKLTCVNGWIYEGDIADGKISGKGVMTMPNGDVYTGDFLNGSFNGQGSYARTDGTVITGTFENGKYIG